MSPAKIGLTIQGAPTSTPRARRAGCPGGYLPYHCVSSGTMKLYVKNSKGSGLSDFRCPVAKVRAWKSCVDESSMWGTRPKTVMETTLARTTAARTTPVRKRDVGIVRNARETPRPTDVHRSSDGSRDTPAAKRAVAASPTIA